jgi:pimeloyl-ACP methyl ester carboxylesterase
MAQDIIDLLDHFGWKNKVHLDGVSMGGMIALELASTWPERFCSLVLTSTTSGRQIPPVSSYIQFIYYKHDILNFQLKFIVESSNNSQ